MDSTSDIAGILFLAQSFRNRPVPPGVKDRVCKALKAHQIALTGVVSTIRNCRKLVDERLNLPESEYAHAVRELSKAIDRAEKLLL
jgi:hypothetical protein